VEATSKPRVTLEIVVTRADGTVEQIPVDEIVVTLEPEEEVAD